jgi:hypothetical protein
MSDLIEAIESPKYVGEYDALCFRLKLSRANPAPNSCMNCHFFDTCGYSAKRHNDESNHAYPVVAHRD